MKQFLRKYSLKDQNIMLQKDLENMFLLFFDFSKKRPNYEIL